MAHEELKPMVRLERYSPEWMAEWETLTPLMQQWKDDASVGNLRTALGEKLIRSLYRIGLLKDA
jgi:hypothetical protein